MKILFTVFILAISVFEVYGVTDSMKVVFFALNKATFDPTLDKNTPSMEDFIDSITVAVHSGTLDHITVYGYSSPDGPFNMNDKLASRRCNAIAEYISSQTGIPLSDIQKVPGGIAWEGLRDLVERNPRTPSRDAVIRILNDYIPDACTDKVKSEQCHSELIDFDDGHTYKWLLRNLFPELRYAVAVYTYTTPERSIGHMCVDDDETNSELETAKDSAAEKEETTSGGGETESTATTADMAGNTNGDVSESAANEKDGFTPPYSSDSSPIDSTSHRLAIKNNFLYDVALMPNLEVELRIDDHWSIALEGGVAWWGKYAKNKSYRLAMVSPEARYWIRPHDWWHGLYVGAFAGGVFYDFLKDRPGYRGDGVMGGLSVGYMWPLNRSLSLEAALGAGYLYTRYKEYIPLDGHHVYQRTKDINYFGPLKVKLALVWRLWDTNKSRRSLVD